jgi:CheY-like chemotaxis protein
VHLVGRVLLAEDNTSNQWIGKAMVAKLGLTVDVVANGREAVEAVRSRPYDLVLMDIGMPEMDGIEATKAIRALPGPAARLPIIAMTAHVLHSERENILGEGLDDFLSKPVDRAELTACLVRWLGSKPGAQVVQAQPEEPPPVGPEPAAAEPASAPVPTSEPAPEPAPAPAPAAQAEPTAPSPPELDGPMIDRAKLVQMCDEVGMDMAPEVLDSFFQELDQQGAALEQAAAAGDLPALARAAHRLKSGAAACGALPLSRIAATLEQAGKAGLVDETAAGMQELARIGPATRAAMAAARKRAD